MAAAALGGVRDAAAAEMACHQVSPARRILSYDGEVERGDGKQFRVKFDECFGKGYRGAVTIDLNSPGGSVDDGLSIARDIVSLSRSIGPVAIQVSRGNYCISACTYIFVAGSFRQVAAGASLEPHGFSSFSGTRVDRAIARAVAKENLQTRGTPVKISRLVFMSKALSGLGASDARLAWLQKALTYFSDWSVLDDSTIKRLVLAYADWTPAQREAFAHLDSVTQLVVTEVERAAALKAFGLHLNRLAGRPIGELAATTGRDDEYVRLMSAEYARIINAWIAKAGAGAALRDLGPARETVAQSLAERVRDVTDTVNQALWPFLNSRTDAIDVEGFVKLMFSTSILYTRPVAREELCDLNLVNRDCE